jgi:hypothetical protein
MLWEEIVGIKDKSSVQKQFIKSKWLDSQPFYTRILYLNYVRCEHDIYI